MTLMAPFGSELWAGHLSMTAPERSSLRRGTAGILGQTRIATSLGWRAATSIAEGDMVLTFDEGLRSVTRVCHHIIETDLRKADRSAWPLHIPARALGNLSPLIVMPGQAPLVESDLAEDVLGDPFVALPACTLAGHVGIEPVRPAERFTVVTLHFEEDQVVFGAGGALFLCAGSGDFLTDTSAPLDYPVLDKDAARMVMSFGVQPAGSAAETGQAAGVRTA